MKRLAAATMVILMLGMLTVEMSDAEMRKTVTPRISVQEQYDDNVDLDPKGFEESDWITSVLPGIALTLEGPRTSLNFDCEGDFSFYRDDSDRDTEGYRAFAKWDQGLSEHVSFYLFDRFIRSEDPIVEYDDRIEDVQRERRVYYRNTGEASLRFDFGKEDRFTVGYRNRYVDERSSDGDDSMGHTGFSTLDLWFGPQYGVSLAPRYTKADFDQDNDFDQYGGGVTLYYRWKPIHRAYCRYDLEYTDYSESDDEREQDDYRVHEGALGMIMALSPHADFDMEAGYYLQDYDNGGDNGGFLYGAGLSLRGKRGSLRLKANGGYEEDYYSSDNLGPNEYYEGLLFVDHVLTQNLRIFASGNYRYEEYLDDDPIRDHEETWRTKAGFSFSFWRWMTVTLDGEHIERNSDDASVEFIDNRATVRLTAAYPHKM